MMLIPKYSKWSLHPSFIICTSDWYVGSLKRYCFSIYWYIILFCALDKILFLGRRRVKGFFIIYWDNFFACLRLRHVFTRQRAQVKRAFDGIIKLFFSFLFFSFLFFFFLQAVNLNQIVSVKKKDKDKMPSFAGINYASSIFLCYFLSANVHFLCIY